MNTQLVVPRKLRHLASLGLGLWLGGLLAGLSAMGQTPPTIQIAYTTVGNAPIAAGTSVGNSGNLYLATLGSASQVPEVIALNSTHSVLWRRSLTAAQVVWGVPTVSPDGTTIYFVTDAGTVHALETTGGNNKSGFTTYQVASAPDVRIRCTPALNVDTVQTGGSKVLYFHANDGNLYAINADTGALIWARATGNGGGPPETPVFHEETWSSSPVIAKDGRIYVGSANGRVYGFTPAGVKILEVNIGHPIEASLAIGADGFLYGGTRESANYNNNGLGGIAFAINPALYTLSNPSLAIVWTAVESGPVGYIASPLIDQSGFVYLTSFAHWVRKYHPKVSASGVGVELASWYLPGKNCQTPAINQQGFLFAGCSEGTLGSDERRFCAIDLATTSNLAWEAEFGGGQTFGDFLGCVLIRGNSTGRVYFADTNGRLFFFSSNSPLMAGDWPTFQSGNRRTGVIGSWPYIIAELPGFLSWVTGASALGSMNAWGEAVGQADGYYMYPANGPYGVCAAMWRQSSLVGFGGQTGYASSYATAINDSGFTAGGWSTGPLAWLAPGSYPVSLSVPAGFTLSGVRANDIAANATIIGYGTRTVGGVTKTEVLQWNWNGTTWSTANVVDGTPPGNLVQAFALSEDLRRAGRAKFVINGPWRAFVTVPQGDIPTTDLGTFGGLESEARDVSAETGTVGWANNASARKRAFYIQHGATALQAFNELPRLAGTTGTTYNSEARSVNRLGQVVGRIQNDANAYRAFVFTPGGGSQVSDLTVQVLENGATPSSLGWVLSDAVAINDGGIITGFGTKSGNTRGWILYPKPVE